MSRNFPTRPRAVLWCTFGRLRRKVLPSIISLHLRTSQHQLVLLTASRQPSLALYDCKVCFVAGAPKSLDKHNSPAAGTGAGGTNFSQGSGYDSGSNVKGYMGTPELLSSGKGYMTTPQGTGPGFGVNNAPNGQNTGIGMSGAGTGSSGYHHGKGMS